MPFERTWTDKDKAILAANPHLKDKQLSILLGRTNHAINRYRVRHKLIKPQRPSKWTEGQKQILADLYTTKSLKELAAMFNVCHMTVYKMAVQMGLKKSKEEIVALRSKGQRQCQRSIVARQREELKEKQKAEANDANNREKKGVGPKNIEAIKEKKRIYYRQYMRDRREAEKERTKAEREAKREQRCRDIEQAKKERAATKTQKALVEKQSREWQRASKRKQKAQRFKTKPLDLSNQTAVRIDHKTIIYIRPGQNKEEVIAKYRKAS